MGIRGDAEARYWKELGEDKPREIALHFIDCLQDCNLWLRLQTELSLSNEQLCLYFEIVQWVKDNLITRDKNGS